VPRLHALVMEALWFKCSSFERQQELVLVRVLLRYCILHTRSLLCSLCVLLCTSVYFCVLLCTSVYFCVHSVYFCVLQCFVA